MSVAVTLCVFRIELSDNCCVELSDRKDFSAMAADKIRMARGRRQMKDITIETYTNKSGEQSQRSLLSGSQSKIATFECSSLESDPKSLKLFSKDSEKPNAKQKIEIAFISGNPFVEGTKGILHLFKENELTSVDSASLCSQTVCILAVPATMTCHDLLTFTAACHEDISHLRIIKDGSPNQYMALLKFRTQQAASEFYSSFNGVPYNSLEPDSCCHLVFVSRVEILHEGEGAALSPPNHTELPTCPVCLERMDESVDGILTILCNHTFHSSCLAKWGDTTCPVCRFVQTPEVVAENGCMECYSSESLWICLICGHVGCGRYVKGHAYEHYLQTQHCYAMQLGSNRVWDYVGDNFVHRLLQNKGDGKLVEGCTGKLQADDKLDSVQLEFTYLLTSQLDSQRLYFEEKLARLENESMAEAAELKDKAKKAVQDGESLNDKISALTREKQQTERKMQQMASKLAATQSELHDERQMSRALQQNLATWQTKFTSLEQQFHEFKDAKEKELLDVKEQLRDVMFFLEAQKQISQSEDREEIAEGRIVIGEPSANPSGSKTRRRRKHH
ncbi:BRCA1-associated protein [Bacillus rossius redtenbacheri]|uniref:BRCA1-associated protein n=1 Tax=Bacillus rossius redtenbacheri TaxID=93214 RepID=UPI002FDEE5CD